MKKLTQKTIYLFSIIFLMSFGKVNAQCLDFGSQSAVAIGPDGMGAYFVYAQTCFSMLAGVEVGNFPISNNGLPVGNLVINPSYVPIMCDIFDPISGNTITGCTINLASTGDGIAISAIDPMSNPVSGALVAVPANSFCVSFDYMTFTNPFTNLTNFQVGNLSCPATPLFQINQFPLPITLKSFNVEKSKDFNTLMWVAEKQVDFSHFEIERSFDGIRFEKIGMVNSQSESHYQFNDQLILTEKSYYRLKMIDMDGRFQYSNIISTMNKLSDELIIVNNPVKCGSDLKIISNSAYQIFTMDGSKVNDLRSLNKGIYFAKNKAGKTAKILVD